VWGAGGGALSRYNQLKAVFSVGAGVDALLSDHAIPTNVQIVRMVEPGLALGMREYVLLHVLRLHRREPEAEADRRAKRWRPLETSLAGERKVGVLGLGALGGDAARALRDVGFAVSGWSRRPKAIEGITCYAGPDTLPDFLSGLDVLVCLLPLTNATAGIIGKDFLARLPRGAALINAARGGLVNEDDLLDALNAGHISHAVLDTFVVEPLPVHPFWTHPRVTVTPHTASLTRVSDGAAHMADGIRRIEAGVAPSGAVDRAAGY
jgi:glyoxylate/hydroxypyruvate reductase A